MRFDELETTMRVFETAHDHCVLPGLYVVVRLDGRGFTKLTKETHPFERPFDARFRDHMIATTLRLMESGLNVVYAYTQSDEISLALHRDEGTFARKERKLNSVLAGIASAKFSLLLGDVAAFDARVCQIPTIDLLAQYFRWRHEDAHRNALSAHCYWLLRSRGETARQASATLEGMSTARKNELLFDAGINFNDLPAWQRRGVGLYWERYEKRAVNPMSGEEASAIRRRLRTDMELPMRDAYTGFVHAIISAAHAEKESIA